MVSKEIISGLELARDIINTSDYSIVAIKNSNVICKKKGEGLRPILELIEELGEKIHECILGDRILGKASSLLCIYSKAKAVYSPQATKTAIALLLINGIPSQADILIDYVKNRDGTDVCPFEKLLENINEPDKAYEILKTKIKPNF